MATQYAWKTLRTSEQELGVTLNEVQSKTEWEVFNIFSHVEITKYRLYANRTIVIVLRRPLEAPKPTHATLAEKAGFRHFADHIQGMRPKDVRKGLVAAGILTKDGRLAEQYK